MKIKVNEKIVDVAENISLQKIIETYKKDADLVIINGYPIENNEKISENDEIVLIKKGEIISGDELEAALTSRHTPRIQEILKNAKVAIAGCGGLGSNAAMSLARMGVGTIRIVDFDVVEPSNLNRQYFNLNQIGMKKTIALEENIKAVTPITKVERFEEFITTENIKKLFSGVDIIIEALDKSDTKTMFIVEALKQLPEVFIIGASGIAGYFDTFSFTQRKISNRAIIVGDFENEAKKGMGLMATRVAVAANIQANLAIRKILGEI